MRLRVVLVAGPGGHSSAGSLRVKPAHGDDDQAEVAHPIQQAVQGGLVRHRAGDDRLAVVTGNLEALEPGRPALIEDPLDTDLVARRRPPAAHARPLSDRPFRLAAAWGR